MTPSRLMPSTPSGVLPVKTVSPPIVMKSSHPDITVVPRASWATCGISTMPPVANMTISQGPHMLANSARALKPKAATSTATAPKTTARMMNPRLVGVRLGLRGEVEDQAQRRRRDGDHRRRDDREHQGVQAVVELGRRAPGDPVEEGVDAQPGPGGDRRGEEPVAQHREQVADGQADDDIPDPGAQDHEGRAEHELRPRDVLGRVEPGEVPRSVQFVLAGRELLGVHLRDLPVHVGWRPVRHAVPISGVGVRRPLRRSS
ncbi:hypothetical protein [Brachybacterium sp. UNK5269]|uniref:hypothetical protein n=1 Tax=Brachybacterium sp. UNK5269 TaxID=3408576 RepID=UPI003BAE76C1